MDRNNNVINLNEYKQTKTNKKLDNLNRINKFKKEDDDRRNTFDLFMRVLATMRKES